jgi:hypothetical protein
MLDSRKPAVIRRRHPTSADERSPIEPRKWLLHGRAPRVPDPYPPGIPAAVPGERLDAAVVEYLRSGVAAGMNIPDAADTSLTTIRVVAQ